MKIFLINSGNDFGIGGIENAYPPLGIISLGTALESKFKSDIEVHLYDGQIDSLKSIVDEIRRQRPDVVGVSMYLTSTRNSIDLILEAKAVGAITVLGNDHAIMHADLLMSKIPEVDFICLNDIGEETIVSLVGALLFRKPVDEVPKLKFRRGTAIFESSTNSMFKPGMSLDEIPIPNRLLLPEKYWSEYARRFHQQKRRFRKFKGNERVSTINRARGCAQKSSPCRYCGIIDLSIRYSSSDIFWNDVLAARTQIGATVLYEAFDSASSAKTVLKRWLHGRPNNFDDVQFKMYAQAFESDEERVSLFKKLGVFCVNMGLDSGDDNVLKLLKGSRHSLEQNKRACGLYTESEIEIYTSFVLFGLGNETNTRKSLDKTLKFAEWLAAETSIVSFDSALMSPDKSAPIGRLIWYPGEASAVCKQTGWDFLNLDLLNAASARWKDEIFLDLVELCSDFAKVCGVSASVLDEYNSEIQTLSKSAGVNFGRSQGGTAAQ
jgi:anaerobic magnesium-protoporphyrin IX monomethyl ester cyclase